MEAVDDGRQVALAGNVSPFAMAARSAGRDLGAAAAGTPMRRMQIVLARSAAQQSALAHLLDGQQNRSSASYHQWLKPGAFGAAFGPSDADLAKLTAWLGRQGFTGIQVNSGRTVVEFSGTAATVDSAFGVTMHSIAPDSTGASLYANFSSPRIPSAFAPIVAGIASLNNLPTHAPVQPKGLYRRETKTGAVTPALTLTSGSTTEYPITPYDFAAIYNNLPLWNAATPIDGSGQTIAIAGDSDINAADFVSFRTLFSLPLGDTTSQTGTQYINVIYNGPKPLINSDEFQADADTQWAAGAAKGATIDYVASQTTETTPGDQLSVAYIVDNNLAPILSDSAVTCELALGASGNAFYNSLWQQAAAQGITVVVPTAQSGAAGCDLPQASPASEGLAVNGLGSTPYNVSVGGTEFYTPNGPGQYFSSSNNGQNASATGYIPETVWNDTCTNPAILAAAPYSGLTAEQVCNSAGAASSGLTELSGSGGGASSCITGSGSTPASCSGGYAKPSWQSGAGVPADNARDTPDVALFASEGRTGSFYLVCQSDLDPNGQACSINAPYTSFAAYGGTQIAAPAFAGILAEVVQSTGERLGNANYVLYPIAAKQTAAGTACVSTASPSVGCVFNDITSGTNAMPCTAGSPNCTVTDAGDAIGTVAIAPAGTGYDLSTGLGSVNAANLVASWTTIPFNTTSSVLTISPSSVVHGSPVTAKVVVSSSSGTPSGEVSLNGETGNGSVGTGTLTGGSLTQSFSSLPGGTYGVSAYYAGDASFAASESNFVSVTVSPEPSTISLGVLSYSPLTQTAVAVSTAPYGSTFYIRADVAGKSGQGIATGNVDVTDNGGILGAGVSRLNSFGYTEVQNNDITPGSHVFTASYVGDASFLASSSPASASLTVTKGATTVSVTPSATTINGNGTVTLTAVLATGGYGYQYPTGSVTFSFGSTVLGSALLSQSQVPNTFYDAGTATLTLPAQSLTTGTDTIVASYPGDTNYESSMSGGTQLTVTTPNLPASVTMVSANPGNVAPGGTIIFSTAVTPLSPAPSGTVQFAVDGSNVSNPIPLSATGGLAGVAYVIPATLGAGRHTLTGVYSGDSTYRSSASAPTYFTVNGPGIPSKPVAVFNATTAVQGTLLSATVTITPSSPVATGTVQLDLDGGPYGQAVTLVNGVATVPLRTNTLQVGPHVVTFLYSGDSNYGASYANATTITISAPGVTPSAVTLQGLASNVAYGAPATFTAAVTPGSPTPTGVVELIVDGGTAGSPLLLSEGRYAFSVPTNSFTLGTHTVQVFYSGDATYNVSTSSVYSFIVGPPVVVTGGFSMSPANVTLSASRLTTPPTLTYTVTPTGGYLSTVTFSCTNLPANTKCTFAPATVAFTSAASVSTVLALTLNTGVAGAIAPALSPRSTAVAWAALLMCLIPLARRRRFASLLSLVVLGALLASATGCGGGYAPGTSAPGNYTVNVVATGSNGSTQTSTIQLTIN